MTVRAFLSHATADKPFVESVARSLGRAAVVFDAYEFATGDDLKEAILTGMERAQLFVLFASKAALQRDWVKFEIAEAEQALAAHRFSQVLTFIIDPDLKIDELPEWLKSSLITRQSSPALVASDIRRAISLKLAEQRPKHFIGRTAEFDLALDTITSFSSPDNRPPLVVYGLSGIGRRSLLDAVARDGLSLKRSHIVRLREGDLLPELSLKLIASLGREPIKDQKAYLDHAMSLEREQIASEIIDNLRSVCEARALPILLDEGGALSGEEGALRPEYQLIYAMISADPDIDAAIISNRRIAGPEGKPLPSVRVSELPHPVGTRLVRLLARDRQVIVSPDEADVVAEYARGYPPALMFAVQEMELYGSAHVASSRHALSRFSEEIFLRQIKGDRKISDAGVSILQLLSTYSPLPLPVIRDYIKRGDTDIVNDVTYLLDYAFLVPDGVNYRISEPIRQAAYRIFGGLRLDHARVADLIEDYLLTFEDDDTRLALSQNLFRASALAGRKKTSGLAISLASDLIDLAVQSYHDKDYDRAIEVGTLAIDARPDSVPVRRFVAQALIRKERYTEAEKHISHLMTAGHIKEAYFVKGFLARRQRDNDQAITDYKKSLEYGRSGVAIHRELASCYFETGDIANAQAQINVAESMSPHNKYIVDLQCQLAIRSGDLPVAEKALRVLSRIDENGFYEHRKSTYENAVGNGPSALYYARKAVEHSNRPQFEMMANLINCFIEAGEYDEAGVALRELDLRFSQVHHDSRNGLRCKLELKRGDIATAEALWLKLKNPRTGVHKGLRAALLNAKSKKGPISDLEAKELSELVEHFGGLAHGDVVKMYGSDLTTLEG